MEFQAKAKQCRTNTRCWNWLVADHLDALKKENAGLYTSGLSAKARGLEGEELVELRFKPSPPKVLVDLAFKTDRTLIY